MLSKLTDVIVVTGRSEPNKSTHFLQNCAQHTMHIIRNVIFGKDCCASEVSIKMVNMHISCMYNIQMEMFSI